MNVFQISPITDSMYAKQHLRAKAQQNDKVLLLGQSALFIIDFLSVDSIAKEEQHTMQSLHWYILQKDIMALSDSLQEHVLSFIERVNATQQKVNVISDEQWVSLTLTAERVITV